jgi:hypothetical protein
LFADIRVAIKVLNERSLVIPSVEFFQDEHSKERDHLVLCRSCIIVVRIEAKVCQWKRTNELVD